MVRRIYRRAVSSGTVRLLLIDVDRFTVQCNREISSLYREFPKMGGTGASLFLSGHVVVMHKIVNA